jgi:glycosyltransferase involved in cell wall biosynthesis
MKIALLTTDAREHYREYTRSQPYFGTAPEALLQGFAQLPDAEIEVVCCVRQQLPSPLHLAPNIRYHALLVPKLGWMSTGYQGCIRAVRRKLRELQPDIVHGQGTERDCAITAVYSGFPNVLTIHGNMRLIAQINAAKPFSYAWLNAHLEAWTIPRSHGVVCITRYTQDAVRRLARKTWVLPNAVDEQFFSVQRAPVEPPVILCVGLVCHRKNQIRLIRALDTVAAGRSFRLVFVGAVPDDAYGAEFSELLRTRPWCECAGFTGRDALRRQLADATLLALPSLEDNCPMVVIEAMAAGVPVAVAEVGGVPDLVEANRTGVFCHPEDLESIRRAVEFLLNDPVLAGNLAARAREEARQRFHPRAIAARHLEVYREVLQNAS